jgi:CDP-glucose 4,6-dehydratase
MGFLEVKTISGPTEAKNSLPALVMTPFWKNRRVLVTGHTGFKGTWLSLWLQQMGARVTGLSDSLLPSPSLFESVGGVDGEDGFANEWMDIRDANSVTDRVRRTDPEIIFHLAAQSLVQKSFADPRLTYETNVIGTVNLLDAVRSAPSVRVAIIVTSDKCYETRIDGRPHVEEDPFGGDDPYSSSKGCAELVAASFRHTYFASGEPCRVATVRAGNVIGGGDWSKDRLVPDVMRAACSEQAAVIRNPDAIRPWQHVLNPLSGYLILAQRLWDEPGLASGWNFGPGEEGIVTVRSVIEAIDRSWPGTIAWSEHMDVCRHEERQVLRLDSTRANRILGWQPTWGLHQGIDAVVSWFDAFRSQQNMKQFTERQIHEFQN